MNMNCTQMLGRVVKELTMTTGNGLRKNPAVLSKRCASSSTGSLDRYVC